MIAQKKQAEEMMPDTVVRFLRELERKGYVESRRERDGVSWRVTPRGLREFAALRELSGLNAPNVGKYHPEE